MGPIWQAQLGESLVMLIGPAGNPIYCPIGHQIWDPLGKQDVCPNFALTAAKFVFSHSENFRAKTNPPNPISCPKRPFGQLMGKNSSAEWDIFVVYSYACTFVLGLFIYIKSRKVRRVPSLSQ